MAGTVPESDFHGRIDVAVRSILSPTQGGRSENQDNYLIIDANGNARHLKNQQLSCQQIEDWPAGHCRLAILDGMGGHSFGREATERVVEGLITMPPTANLGLISGYLDDLHLRLHEQMHIDGAEPGCTLTLLELPPMGPALLFHAGDSRLYVVDSERAEYLTVDHVPATKFALFGLLDADEWHRQAHEASGFQISQAFILGNSLSTRDLFGEALERSLFELSDRNLPGFLKGLGDRRTLQLMPDRTYVMASDGLWHLSQPLAFIDRWPELIGDTSEPLAQRLEMLFDQLIEATSKEPRLRGDNTTAIAFRLLG